MPSPFPGMDPYLENPAVWPDFHMTFLVALRPELNKNLPPPYVARLDRYVWVDEGDEEEPRLLGKPDVFMAEECEQTVNGGSAVAVAAPWTVTLPQVDHKGKPYLKLIDTDSRRVVTVIELLSPTNKKAGKDRDLYLAKREDYLASKTNLVEIDLLRKGLRAPTVEQLPPTDYRVLVCRAADFPSAGAWFFSVRDPLPDIHIPLKPGEPEVLLSLSACMRGAYDLASYDKELDYSQPPNPPLADTDAAWAQELLARTGS